MQGVIAGRGLRRKSVSVYSKYSATSISRDFVQNRSLYLLAIPGLVYYVLFQYGPMYGAIIAFKDFTPRLGFLRSEWVGLRNFTDFFTSHYFWRLVRNTLILNVLQLFWGFPAPILLALALNEVRRSGFKRTIQTVSYLPHFISTVVVCGMIIRLVSYDGLVVDALHALGMDRVNLLSRARYFRTIYVVSEIWQRAGWGSIIFLAALTAIDPELYDAADVDGAKRFQRIRYITVPGILPTIVILLILRLGQMMSIGFEKILLLYNPLIYETADVIPTFVYRKGLLEASYSYATAVGLFNSVINLSLLLAANKLSRAVNETSLW